jgi:hypothetical protein
MKIRQQRSPGGVQEAARMVRLKEGDTLCNATITPTPQLRV